MAELDERIAHLETGMEDQKQLNADLRADFRDLRLEMREGFGNARAEIAALRSTTERGFERVDQKFEPVNQRFDRLDHKIDKHFMWLVGIMLTGFLTGFGAMFTLFLRVLDGLPG